ncbi:MAG: hypothetical protein RLY71_67 [Pseudomonadota bacterium]|jgi:hypothetical protein
MSSTCHTISRPTDGITDDDHLGEAVACTIFQAILRSCRLTVEQMALLEPGLSETVCATLLDVMREAMDEVVARGVPADCGREFLLGHMTILSAVIFKQIDAIEAGQPDAAEQATRAHLTRSNERYRSLTQPNPA